MNGILGGKVAIVTGAGQGIGEGIARCFSEAGARVLVATRTYEKGKAVVDSIVATGGIASALKADVGGREEVEQCVTEAVRIYGRLDIVVHNAGGCRFFGLKDLTDAELERTLAVNLKAGFWLIQAALPHLRKQGGGRFLFVSSITGPKVAMPCAAHYAAAKNGLIGLIRTAALEFARDNITVNGVEPGFILTPGMTAFADEQEIAAMARNIPMGRLGKPVDIANTMLFLASDSASYITGQTVTVDAGCTLSESPVFNNAYYASIGK
jgi:3-oxoacyl-[acyl-carrier protein] reductase